MLPIEPPSRMTESPRSIGPGEPVEMLRVGGDVYSVPDIATLQRWILEQRVTPADMVSQHGMRWTALQDRPDFALFFTAAHSLGARSSSPTLEPTPSHVEPRRHLPMADDEEIYVHEVNPGDADAPTTFIGELPPPEPAPHAHPFPVTDDPTVAAPRPRPVPLPVDELPPALAARAHAPTDDPDALLLLPEMPTLREEALGLGFQLGPDPDTQEATIEQTHRSADPAEVSRDPTEAFMRGEADLGRPTVPPLALPPPVVLHDGRVPVTVAPQTAVGTSVLDEELEPDPPSRLPLFLSGAAGAVLVLIAAGWWFTREPEAPALAEGAPPALESRPVEVHPPGQVAPVPKPPEPAAAAAAVPPPPEPKPVEAKAEPKPPAPKPPEPVAATPAVPKPVAARPAEPKPAEPKPVAAKPAEPKPAAEKGGGSARTLADQGWKAMDKGDVESAHGFFSRALQKDPNAGWALYGRGYANEKLGDKVSAKADYCTALSGAGTDTELSRELAGGLRRLGGGC